MGSLTNWKQVAGGNYHTAAIKTDGTLWTWGDNSYGQLGLGNQYTSFSPVQVGSLTNWKQVAGGSRHTAAIKTDGTLWAWGFNGNGELGLGDTINRSSPVQVGTLTNWKQVVGGESMMSVFKDDGTLWSVGSSDSGKLAIYDLYNFNQSSPVQVGTLTDWKLVAGGNYHTAAIKTDGTLWSWGYNGDGQLGLGDTTDRFSPVQVGTLTNWKQVVGGAKMISVFKDDGTLWSAGSLTGGQLAVYDLSIFNQSSPVQVGTLTNWKQVSCGGNSVAAIKTDGTLWTWGANSDFTVSGHLGLNDTTHKSSPTQVGALTDWKQVVMSRVSAAAIKTDGTLWTWGYNSNGELGVGDRFNRSSPVQVGALTNWKQVSMSYGFTSAVKTDGTLWAWGHNTGGELGTGNTTYYSSPVQVGTLTNWKQVACANPGGYTAAIKTDGTLWVWGYGGSQLGLGDTTSRSSPVQVGALTNWKQVSGGSSHTVAIQAPDLPI